MIAAGGKFDLGLKWAVLFLLAGFLEGGCRQIPQYLSVCEVQSVELLSPFLDREVILSGLVSGIQGEGVMILDESCPLDGEGSRGIYIQLPGAQNLLEVGDGIRVRGWVREQGEETRLEASPADLDVLSLDNPLPEPVDLGAILVPPLLFGYENWEGQLVLIPQADLSFSLGASGRYQIHPRIKPGPTRQLICFQSDSFSLGLSWDLLDLDPDDLQMGGQLSGLLGWIRQDPDGYYLQLIEEPLIITGDGDRQAGGDFPERPAEAVAKTATVSPARSEISTPIPSAAASQTPAPQPSRSPTIVPTPTYYQVQLLISEIFPNPPGDEPGGEWIELYNPQRGWLLLNGIKIGDEISPTGSEGLLRFPDGYYLEGGKTLLIANQARIFESCYGFLPDFELENSHPLVPDLRPYYGWGRSAIKLSNSGDEVLLLDPWDEMVDLVVYGKASSASFSPAADAPKEGHSLERYPPDQDLGLASDWREQVDPSPGKLDRSTPTPDFSATAPVPPSPTNSPSPGLPSPTSSLTPASLPTNTLAGSATIQPGTPDQTLTPAFTSTPAPPTLSLTPSPGDSTPILPTASQPSPTGDTTSTAQVALTLTATLEGGATPSSEPTETSPAGPSLLINEILVDPDPLQGDSNGDGQISHDDDEFLELVNISGQPLDISGWQVFDGIRLRYTFPEGVLIAPNCGLVLFGGGSPSGGFGGSLVFTAGSLGLNNEGDQIKIQDRNGQVITGISYGSEGNQDQSLTRDPDLSSQLSLVLHSLAQGSSGALFSPGTRVDGSVFGVCPSLK